MLLRHQFATSDVQVDGQMAPCLVVSSRACQACQASGSRLRA